MYGLNLMFSGCK